MMKHPIQFNYVNLYMLNS